MDMSTALVIALVLVVALFIPYAVLLHPPWEGAWTHLVHLVETAGPLGHRPGPGRTSTDSTWRRRCAGGSLLIGGDLYFARVTSRLSLSRAHSARPGR